MRRLTFLVVLCAHLCYSQTTDLAVTVEAQDLNGNAVSQVHIYQEFQYLVTLSNSGDSTTNASFTQSIAVAAEVISFTSQNALGGASPVTDFELTNSNVLSGTIADMPTSSSVQIRVVLRAPIILGGIATQVTVAPAEGTTDTNTTNNQAIISIDVTDVEIDFSASVVQVSPVPGLPINNWGDNAVYQFTINNNSVITYPLMSFAFVTHLITPIENGSPRAQIQSVECLSTTGEMNCVTNIETSTDVVEILDNTPVFVFDAPLVIPSNSSITFEIVYTYLEPICAEIANPIDVENFIELSLEHDNSSSNESNRVTTLLPEAIACLLTDVAIETIIVSPDPNAISSWTDEVLLRTEVVNNGPSDAPIQFFIQNLSADIVGWGVFECCLYQY